MTDGGGFARAMGGCVLVAALLMLAVRHPGKLAGLCAAQAWALALAMAAQGLAQDRGALLALALTVFAVQGLLLPLGLRSAAHRPGPADMGHQAAASAGLLLALLALSAMRAVGMSGGLLAEALAVALLGLLTIVIRRGPAGQLAGLLSMAAGCTLGAAALPGLPVPGLLIGPAMLLLPALGLVLALRP